MAVWPWSPSGRSAGSGCSLWLIRWMGHHESRRELHTIRQIPVDSGAGDAEHLGDVDGVDALACQVHLESIGNRAAPRPVRIIEVTVSTAARCIRP
jgi:hypothetical protein